jgi:hypothetical protein
MRMSRKTVAACASSHFYVYYRVTGDTAAVRATIRALMADVEARTGISGRLLARSGDSSMWMEIYEPVANADAFARTLAACVRRCMAVGVAADGLRTLERFAELGRLPARPRPYAA